MMNNDRIDALFKVIGELRTKDEVQQLFEDLCTPAEITAMADRWHVVLLLEEGLPYRTINELSGVSTATITRVARCLTAGAGGYRRMLKLKKRSPKT